MKYVTGFMVVFLVLLLASPVMAQPQLDNSSGEIVVSVEGNGDASVIFVDEYTSNGAGDEEQFNSWATEIVEEINKDTERTVSLESTSVEVIDHGGETKEVFYTARVNSLGEVNRGGIEINEPFDTVFSSERELVFIYPQGYEFGQATPSPDVEGGNSVSWDSASFDSFEVKFVETGDDGLVYSAPTDDGDNPIVLIGIMLPIILVIGVAVWYYRY